jgi:WD40 repeat protein
MLFLSLSLSLSLFLSLPPSPVSFSPSLSSSFLSSFSSVTSCQGVPEVGDIITGNTNNCVELYRYPAVYPSSLHQSYIGHASAVSCVRFSYNRRHAISMGSMDCTILLWSHSLEQADSSDDDNGSVASSVSSDGGTY